MSASQLRYGGRQRAASTRPAYTLVGSVTAERIAGGARQIAPEVIKSAGRTLQILELFDVLQRPAALTEVAELLSLPQSSTSMLMRSLVAMGYLAYDARSRTYSPTPRVALLGKWSASPLFADGSLIGAMHRINQRTGQAVVLATRDGLHSRYIQVVQATQSVRLFVVQGSERPLVRSGTGYALLAQLEDEAVLAILRRTNAEGGVSGELVDQATLMDSIAKVRATGTSFTLGLVTPAAGMIAVPLAGHLASEIGQPAAIGIGGIDSVLRGGLEKFSSVLAEELLRAERDSST